MNQSTNTNITIAAGAAALLIIQTAKFFFPEFISSFGEAGAGAFTTLITWLAGRYLDRNALVKTSL